MPLRLRMACQALLLTPLFHPILGNLSCNQRSVRWSTTPLHLLVAHVRRSSIIHTPLRASRVAHHHQAPPRPRQTRQLVSVTRDLAAQHHQNVYVNGMMTQPGLRNLRLKKPDHASTRSRCIVHRRQTRWPHLRIGVPPSFVEWTTSGRLPLTVHPRPPITSRHCRLCTP